MRLSDIKGADALSVLADLIEPVGEIMTDKEILQNLRKGGNKFTAISLALRNHPNAAISILATLDGKSVAEYTETLTVGALPLKLLELLNDPTVVQLFFSQGQTGAATSSGSASAKTE